MSKSRSTSQQTYGWQTPPVTADTQAVREAARKPVDYSAAVRRAYAWRKSQRDRTYNDLLGGNTTPGLRTAMKKEDDDTFAQAMGLDLANAAQSSSADEFQRLAAVQGMTAPHLVQTGGTATQSQSPFAMAMQIGQMASSIGSAALG